MYSVDSRQNEKDHCLDRTGILLVYAYRHFSKKRKQNLDCEWIHLNIIVIVLILKITTE